VDPAAAARDDFFMRDIRSGPRIDVEALCWELVDGRESCALAVDLSSLGVRLERTYVGGPTIRCVPLQIEVPEIDEVIWARGDACFDVVVPRGRELLRRTGYRITGAGRDMRMLEELVIETHRKRLLALAGEDDYYFDFNRATCYARA
jgi:hypothetical protein